MMIKFLFCKSELFDPFTTKHKPVCIQIPWSHTRKRTGKKKKEQLSLLDVHLQRHCPKCVVFKIAEFCVPEIVFMLYL